eukprot:7172829-Prymnesium_polylepis.1
MTACTRPRSSPPGSSMNMDGEEAFTPSPTSVVVKGVGPARLCSICGEPAKHRCRKCSALYCSAQSLTSRSTFMRRHVTFWKPMKWETPRQRPSAKGAPCTLGRRAYVVWWGGSVAARVVDPIRRGVVSGHS